MKRLLLGVMRPYSVVTRPAGQIRRNFLIDSQVEMQNLRLRRNVLSQMPSMRWLSTKVKDQDPCWNCGKKMEGQVCFFCPHCDRIQQPVEGAATYFDVFGIDHKFDVDPNKLTRKHWDLQKQLHPDKHGDKTEEERDFATQHSAFVNEAYNNLKTPLKRAAYLLKLSGVDALQEGGKSETDPETLMMELDAREELASCETESELKRMHNNTVLRLKDLEAHLVTLFEKGALTEATKVAVKLRYASKLLEDIDQKLHNLHA